MIYYIVLLLCLVFVWYYDILGNNKNKDFWYSFLMICFIAVSACQYRLGSDLPVYIQKYEDFNTNLVSRSIFFDGDDRRQPGWVLLVYLCRLITSDYLLMKCIQAVFLNCAVFAFFKRETKYAFSCILLYAIFSYFVLNFNVLRQSYAIGFGLYAFSCVKKQEWFKYALFTFLAYMFHNSALVLLSFPLFHFFNVYTKGVQRVYFVLSVIIVLYLGLSSIDLESLFANLFESGIMNENMEGQAVNYMGSENLGVQEDFVAFSLKRLFVALLILYYVIKCKDLYVGGLGITYLFILALSAFMPIFWRFQLYFEFAYLIIVSQVAYEFSVSRFSKRFKIGSLVYLFVIFVAMYHPIQDYFTKYQGSRYRYIDQYYPYQNIFTKEVDKNKEFFFSPY